MSPDHRHLLLIADTPVSMTDYNDSKLMLDYLYDRLQHHCPTGVAYRVICGHRYTLANAMTIQQDMRRVLCISLTGLLVIFVMFLRNWRIMYVFMIPLVALVNGIMVTGWVVGSISAITIGFGAVLLGISADYGLHVSGFEASPYGIEWMRFDEDSPISELISRVLTNPPKRKRP